MIKNDRFEPRPSVSEQPRPADLSGEPTAKKKSGGWQIPAVQSIACVIAVLAVLLLRSVGGDAYRQLQERFRDGLMRNDLLATLAVLWDGDPAETVSVGEPAGEEPPAEPEPSDSTDPTGSTEPTEPTEPSTTAPTTSAPQTVSPTGVSAPAGAVAVRLRVNRIAAAPVASGRVTSGYGYRDNPTGAGTQFHAGIDVAAPAGTPIAAMFFGKVTDAGVSDSFGNYIRLDHGDGVEVLYAHCSSVDVTPGTVVRPGETVARVGATGDATGNHVHIQISRHQTVYNPSGIVPVERYA